MPITINGSTGIGGVDGSAGTPAYQGTDTNTGISFGTDVVIASTGGVERARLDSAGRLLVGTSSSSQIGPGITGLMQIEGLSGTTLSVFGNANNTGGGYLTLGKSRGTSVGSNTIVNDSDELGGIYFAGADGVDRAQSAASIIAFVDGTPGANDMPGRLVFSTTADGFASPGEAMRIDSNKRTTVQNNSGLGGLQVTGGSLFQTILQDRISFSAGGGSYYIVNQSVIGVALGHNATAWSAQSDERKKTDLIEINNGLNKIASLRAVTGRYKADEPGTSRSFLIAQDVQQVLPEAVDIEDDEDQTLMLRYTDLVPLLVAALKESKERIETLEARITTLEAQP